MKTLCTLLLILVAAPAVAQVDPPESPVVVSLDSGVLGFFGKDEDKEWFTTRATVRVRLTNSGLTLVGRGDLNATQDGSTLDLPDLLETFRSIEAVAGLYHPLGPFSFGGIAGVTWSAEEGVVDPRQKTFAGILRYGLPHDGYVYVGVGHHEPVGGAALLVSTAVGKQNGDGLFNGAYTFVDFALPLRETALQERAWTLKTGIAVRVFRKGLW